MDRFLHSRSLRDKLGGVLHPLDAAVFLCYKNSAMNWHTHAAWATVVATVLSSVFGWAWSEQDKATRAAEAAIHARLDLQSKRIKRIEDRSEWFFRLIYGKWQDNPSEFGE